jgi:hypothetical protein
MYVFILLFSKYARVNNKKFFSFITVESLFLLPSEITLLKTSLLHDHNSYYNVHRFDGFPDF